MKTTGILVGSISTTSLVPPVSPKLNAAESRWIATLLSVGDLLEGLTEEVQRSLKNISIVLNSYEDLSQNPTSSLNTTEYDPIVHHIYILDAYINAVISGRIAPRERASREHITEIMTGSPCNPSTCTAQEFSAKVAKAIHAGMSGRTLAITKSGHIGAVPQTAEIGDEICVLYGCSVPVVLRPSTEVDSYKFVGECYLHGFMDAEAIALHMKGVLQEKIFALA